MVKNYTTEITQTLSDQILCQKYVIFGRVHSNPKDLNLDLGPGVLQDLASLLHANAFLESMLIASILRGGSREFSGGDTGGKSDKN